MKGDMKRRCTRCHKVYSMGENGIHPGLCDTCANISRDSDGVAFSPWEDTQTFIVLDTGEEITKTHPGKGKTA